jgi:hypothetical protein
MPVDAEKNSKHFMSAHLVMKVNIEEIMGDQRIFGSKNLHFWIDPEINFFNPSHCAKFFFFVMLRANAILGLVTKNTQKCTLNLMV